MTESIIRFRPAAEADVVLIGARYDRTTSFGKGADLGPAAVLHCLETQLEIYDRVSQSAPAEELSIARADAGDLAALDPPAMVRALRDVYESHAGRLRVLIGGEHSVSNAAWLALADRAARTTIVQIDAHADLREDDSDYNDVPYGRFAHSAVMHRAHELGFRIVQVGVRAYSRAEQALFDDERITVFEWGPRPPAVETIASAIATEEIYITLDVDGLDPSVMPATGTPVPGGLSWYYTLDLLKEITRGRRVVGADVVEVAPRAGDVRTEYAAAQLVYSLVGLALCTP